MRKRLAFGMLTAVVVMAGLVGVGGPAGAATATLSKTSGLHFYERVTVHTGEAPGTPLLVDQCFDSAGTDLDRCIQVADTNVPAGGDVTVVLTRRIESRIPQDGSTLFLDCIGAGVACQVSVRSTTSTTIVPVTFDSALPALSVTPNSNLGWNTSATVHGTGFLPGQEFLVTQCARLPVADGLSCAGVLHEPHATADATGAFTFPTTIRRLIPSHFDPSRATVDCAHVDCFERVSLPPFSRAERPPYVKGTVDTALHVADDGIPAVLVKPNILQTEHHTQVRIRVDLTAPAASPLTVEYGTGSVTPPLGDGAAMPGSDYVAKTSRLHFLPGETHHVITIVLVDDNVSEPYEVFAVNFAGAFHANTRQAIIRIANDDH